MEPSEAVADVLADPALPVGQFSAIVALTMPIPRGGGIAEYVIIEDEHRVSLTRIVPF